MTETNVNTISPAQYGLPADHAEWREGQYESIVWGLGLDRDRQGVLEAPPGSGKSAIVRAISTEKPVITLCKTKFLQRAYDDTYGFAAHYGRANYPCVHPDNQGKSCDRCLYDNMYDCGWSGQCPYLMSKRAALSSPRTVLNYPYWLMAKGWRTNHAPAVLVCDEAHLLPDIVTQFCGCTITDKQRVEWSLPPFPNITGGRGGMFVEGEDSVQIAVEWLGAARGVLVKKYRLLSRCADEKSLGELRRCERLGHKVRATMDALSRSPLDWYIKSGGGSEVNKHRGGGPRLISKPLTARYHFSHFFLGNFITIAMSATIGDPGSFAAECGLGDYSSRVVPHRYKAEDRPIVALDVPNMGMSAGIAEFNKQADSIAKAILGVDPRWSGIILVTRKREAKLLADRLARRGLQDRVFVPPGWDQNGRGVATDTQVAAWRSRLKRAPNSLCISWSFWEGYDGRDEKIDVVAKVPYPYLGDSFERARMQYSGKMYLQRTAWGLEQGLGRTRRGRPEDYGIGAGLVAIADGAWTRIKKYLSESARDAIVVENKRR